MAKADASIIFLRMACAIEYESLGLINSIRKMAQNVLLSHEQEQVVQEVVAYIRRACAHEEEKEEGAVESDVALDCFQIGSSRSGHQ